jgi:Tol biopolymer transport system component
VRAVALGLTLFLALALSAAAADGTHSIAFTTGLVGERSRIVLADPEAGTVLELTPGLAGDEGSDRSPTWSPDGTRLAFDAHRGVDVEEIYTMNADGSARRRLTFDSGGGSRVYNVAPAWSPDGNLIAWLKQTGSSSARDVWVMSSDGTGQRRLTSDGGSKSTLGWSPDSSRLLYTKQMPGSEVHVLDVATGTARSLSQPGTFEFTPAWSPDGTEIALVSRSRLVVADADGTGRREVRTTAPQVSSPEWSPDGERIAFAGTRLFPEHGSRYGPATRIDVFVIGADGAGERRLTGSVLEGYVFLPGGSTPVWWPDGSRLFFGSERAVGERYRVFVMNADGTCEQRFGPEGTRLLDPVWKPGVQPRLGPLHCVDLKVLASFERNVVGLGGDAALRVAVENDGNEAATGVVLRLSVTRGRTRLVSGEAVCSRSEPLECTLAPLGPGRRTEIVLAATSSTAGSASVQVEARSDGRESDLVTNRATSRVEILPCRRVGTNGSDHIVGSPRRDTICARAGYDVVRAGAGNDWIDAGPGYDTVIAGQGRDTVLGGGERDTILLRDGARDYVSCGGQRDLVLADRLDRVSRDCERVSRL